MEKTEIRASRSSYLIFGGIGILCIAISTIDGLVINLVLSTALLIAFILWIRSYKITITEKRLSSASLLSSFSINGRDVESVTPIFFIQRSTPIGLKIRLKGSPTEYRLTLKPFSSHDVGLILTFFHQDVS